VLKYFHDGCSTGDLDVLLSTLDPNVVHNFPPTRFPPIRGAGLPRRCAIGMVSARR
jgi:hypothetical protein